MATKHLKSTLTQICEQVWASKTLEIGKKLILDHVESTDIKPEDKKRITRTVNECKTKYKLDYYLANSILMFEGMGLNPKPKTSGIEVTVENA